MIRRGKGNEKPWKFAIARAATLLISSPDTGHIFFSTAHHHTSTTECESLGDGRSGWIRRTTAAKAMLNVSMTPLPGNCVVAVAESELMDGGHVSVGDFVIY